MVSGFMMYHVAISVIAAAMAWGLARLAGLLGWARRGVWVLAILCSVAAPAALLLGGEPATPTSRWDLLPETPLPPVDNKAPASDAPAPDPRLPAAASVGTTDVEDFEEPVRLMKLRLPAFPEWDGVLARLWVILSAAVLGVLLFSMLQVRRSARVLPTERWEGVELLVSKDFGPAVIGWLRPRIIVPGCVLDSEHCRLVLMHEQSHARAHDPLLFGVLVLVVALVPWNPVLWWQLRQLRFTIEVDCDRRVLQSGADVCSYGETLLHVAQLGKRSALGSTALTEPVSQLGKRVQIMTAELSRLARVRLAAVSLGVLGASAVIAAQVEPPGELRSAMPESEPAATLGGQGAVVPSSLSLRDSASAQEDVVARNEAFQAALADPERRRELRRAQRVEVESLNPDLVAVLGLDARTGEQFLDLLADQQLATQLGALESQARFLVARRETLFRADSRSLLQVPVGNTLEQAASIHSRERSAIRELLGETRFGQYLDYRVTLAARLELAKLNDLLPAQPLSTMQREQMVALLIEEQRYQRDRSASYTMIASGPDALGRWGLAPSVPGEPMSPQAMRDSLSTSQYSLTRLIEGRERLLGAAARVLNPIQLEALGRVANERIEAAHRRIQELQQSLDSYAAAGGAQVPERLRWAERAPLTGRIRWSLGIAINDSVTQVSSLATNLGESVSIDVGQGLLIDVRPVAYDTKGFMLDLRIYELDRNGGKHLLEGIWDVMSFRSAADSDQAPLELRKRVLAGSQGFILAYGATASLE